MKDDVRRTTLTCTLLAASMFLTACGRRDAEFTKALPGTWKQELNTFTDTLAILPDGTFSFSRLATNADTTFTNTGTWQIRGGKFILTATNRFGTHALPLGDIFKGDIIHLDEHMWVFETEGGLRNSFRR